MSKTVATAPAPAAVAAAPTTPPAAPAPATKQAAAAAAPAADVAATPDKSKAAAAPAGEAEPEVRIGDDVPDEAGDVPALGDDVVDEGEETADAPEGDEAEAEAEKPIDYEFEAPEGAQPYREAILGAYKDVLQKHRIDPAAAKDILETMMPAIAKDADAQLQEHIKTQTDEWRAELGERHGEKLRDVMNLVNRGLAKAATPELRKFIRESALAWHPDFVDMLAWFSQRVTNDRTVKTSGGPHKKDLDPQAEIAAAYDEAEKRGE